MNDILVDGKVIQSEDWNPGIRIVIVILAVEPCYPHIYRKILEMFF